MRFVHVLALGAVAVVVVTAIGVAFIPGVLADHETPERPGDVRIAEVTITEEAVTGETATLRTSAHLRHRGNPTPNVSVVVRAVDDETGFIATETRQSVGTLSDARERTVDQSVTVPREGGYRIETVLYADGRRVDLDRKSVRGLGTLQPAYARSPVEFHAFDGGGSGLPAIQYSVAEVNDDRVTLNVSAFLTNRGDEASDRLDLVLIARQSESGIVAARQTITTDPIGPGRTATPSTTLVVPDGYNYYLAAILQRDGVIVGSARSAANLLPTERIDANVTTRSVGIEVSDFEADRRRSPEPPAATSTPTPEGPGLGALGAALGVVIAALLARRRRRGGRRTRSERTGTDEP